jgi:hypothetical protein
MECIEIELLASIGYANPYHEHGWKQPIALIW